MTCLGRHGLAHTLVDIARTVLGEYILPSRSVQAIIEAIQTCDVILHGCDLIVRPVFRQSNGTWTVQ